MQVRVMLQVRPPGVKDGEEADLRTQMFGVGGYGSLSFGHGPEENAVKHLLVLVGDRGNLFRHREYNVEVLAVEEFGLAALDPLSAGQTLTLRTVAIPAGAVANALVAALIALLNLPSESRRPAHLDGSHDAPLRRGHRRAMLLSVGFAVTTEDIRHFQFRALHGLGVQKCWGVAGAASTRMGCGNRSSGLEVEQTLLVAIRR